MQNGPRNLKEDHFLTQKPPSELFNTALMDQDRSFIFRILAGFSYVHSAKGDFKSSLLNSSEGGFWVRKWSSFRSRGPFCKWRGFIVIVSAPNDQELQLRKLSKKIYSHLCLHHVRTPELKKGNSRASSANSCFIPGTNLLVGLAILWTEKSVPE